MSTLTANLMKYLVLGLIPIMLFALPIVPAAQENTDPPDEQEVDPQAMLEEIDEEKAVLERELTENLRAEDLMLKELDDLDQHLCGIADELKETTADQRRKVDRVENLKVTNSRAVANLEAAQEIFETRLVEWYKTGAGSMLGSLITTGDLSDFFHVISYMEAIMRSDGETIDFIRDQQAIIYEQTQELEKEIAESDRLLAEMREKEAYYEELQEARYEQFEEIAQDRAAVQLALAELEASSLEFQRMLQSSRYTGIAEGSLRRPINASINSGFGMRRHPIFGGMRMHTGVDMAAAYGTSIHAAQGGKVVYSGWKRGYGNTVMIRHSNELATLYAHCSMLLVKVGDFVDSYQVIAKVGSTGYSTGNHLHFEVRVNGKPVNPEDYI